MHHWPETKSSRLVAARLVEEVGRLTWEPFDWFKRPFIVYFFGPGKNGLTSKMASKLRCHEPTSSQATCFKENREKKKERRCRRRKGGGWEGRPIVMHSLHRKPSLRLRSSLANIPGKLASARARRDRLFSPKSEPDLKEKIKIAHPDCEVGFFLFDALSTGRRKKKKIPKWQK